MTIGTQQDFRIAPEEFFGGMVEVVEQNADAFNAASGGAIRLVPERRRGHYAAESFISRVASLVTRRDIDAVTDVADTPLAQAETVGIKINRRIGPVANTLDSLRKLGRDPGEMSFLLGRQIGKAVAVDYVDTALRAASAALSGVAALDLDVSGEADPGLAHGTLVRAMARLGDAGGRISCFVMHSKPYYDLMAQSVADKVFEVAGVTIYQGTVASFGRPTLVIDSPALVTPGTPDRYRVLGLVEDAIEVAESEERSIVSDVITGLENLVMRIQGEYAFNVRLRGFAWDVVAGGINPTDVALEQKTNWQVAAADVKSLAGVRLTVA
ncbi:major capsid protein [Tistrella mobilis]|uniref:major capsid protein n=1 Tax=Tistrella mobilis TaxID=171437 RepID=UPI0035590BB7